MIKNEDRRVRKTKKAMTDALAELLLEKPLNNISVREISDMADINRGTFYLHYRDVYDMVEQLQTEIFDKFNEIVDNHEPNKKTDELLPMLSELFNLLSENAMLVKVLIGKNGDAAFIDKLKNVFSEKFFPHIQKNFGIKNDDKFNYVHHFIISGCIGICSAWLDGGMKETSLEMAAFTEKLIIKIIPELA